jgi:hypothetical protein
MKYLMLHTLDESTSPNTAECGAPDALQQWIDEMLARGVVLDGARLRPVSDATSVRVRDGEALVVDGPFAETKEQVAGYDVIDCPDLDSAIAVAGAHPTLDVGSIEIRQFAAGMPDPEVPEMAAEGKLRYLLLVCADMTRAMAAAKELGDTSNDQSESDDHDEVDDWVDSVSGSRIYGWPLEFPDQAVTLRKLDGRVVTTDGPFAETKEQIAGYDLLECADLDEALAAAASHPVAGGGVVEVRPLWA